MGSGLRVNESVLGICSVGFVALGKLTSLALVLRVLQGL